MEYAMCTLIFGRSTFDGLIGVIAHENGILGFNMFWHLNEEQTRMMDGRRIYSYLERFGMTKLPKKGRKTPHEGSPITVIIIW